MTSLFAIFKQTSFLLVLCGILFTSTATLALRTASLGAQVTTMTVSAAVTAIAHRKAIAAAVLRTKAKARIRRAAVAVPFVGAGLLVEFERRDFFEWQEENPEGTMGDYSCEMATVSAEVVDEVLQDLPERVRPSKDTVLSWLPECGKVEG